MKLIGQNFLLLSYEIFRVMDDLLIPAQEDSPEINFNAKDGVLRITGRAYSNDMVNLFKKLNIWLDEYLANPSQQTTLMLQIDYSNSVCSRLVYDFIVKCKNVLNQGKQLNIKWYHYGGDEDGIDYANLVSKLINYPIENIEID